MIRHEGRTAFVFLSLSLGGTAVFLLIPYMDVFRRALYRAADGSFCGLENFQAVVFNQAFRLAAKNTGVFILICIPVLLLLSLGAALVIFGCGRRGGWLKTGLLIPMAIPAASAALLWKLLFHKQGFLNGFLHILGIYGPDWMNTKAAFWVLAVSYIWKNLGCNTILWLAGLTSISPWLYEAAELDGAGPWKKFRFITLPGLYPSILVITVLTILNSFKVFREAWLVAGEYPHESMYLLQHVFSNWFRDLSLDKMAAGAVLNSLILIALILLLQKFWGWRGENR